MLIPEYWAEASGMTTRHKKTVTIRRFGWSNTSQAEAQSLAEQRVQQAIQATLAGENIARRELKTPYNGSDGVPIREEVIERHPHCVITRNAYGAQCLNTAEVLFADIDFEILRKPAAYSWAIFFIVIFSFMVGKYLFGFPTAFALALATWFISHRIGSLWWSWQQKRRPSAEEQALARVDQFLVSRPLWHVRIYRTPAGLRLLAMHQTFGADEAEVAESFAAFRTDKIYVQMCSNQHCFRARVSPKPWRIGIQAHLKPRPGVWPIDPSRLPDRQRWVEQYERTAQGFAACRFLIEKGSGRIDPIAEEVRAIHDQMCKALEPLPIA